MESIDRTSAQTRDQAGSRGRKSCGEIGAGDIGGRATRDLIPEQLLPEQLLASLWQKRAARQQRFKTNGGRQVRVLYPGRPSSSAGPDFRDAVFHLEGLGLVRGAVEIHRRQRDWDSHGHGADPNYNGVVLHVALEVDGGDTRLQSGQQVPVVSLASLLDTAGTPADPGPSEDFFLWALLKEKGYPRPPNAEQMAHLLDRAGDARFRQKSARYQAFLKDQTLPEQTLYEGICEALGYRHNQQPFLRLAQRSPSRALVQSASYLPREKRAGALEGWLLQLSGLAESPDIKLPRVGLGPPLARREWHCFRVRPANHPRRRVAGAAALLARFLEAGLVAGLQQAAESGIPSRLTAALVVGKSDAGGRSLIGSGRARDLAVNVVLPFFHALETHALAAAQGVGDGEGDSGQRYSHSYFQSYRQSYRRFGLLQDNELLREMRDRLIDPTWEGVIDSARRQQGLLHLHHLLRGGG
ncbi:MAG: DUF2851 family protein [Chloroflexi bacterium]|nr:DUF2851 family protein [Chloroflexota bacterium]